MIDVVLKASRERSVLRRHPWVLSGAVERVSGGAEPGAWARVSSQQGKVLGFGHYSPSSQLRVRMLTFGETPPSDELITRRIATAVEHRREHPLLGGTDALRLVNAEGDGLPGLVVDRYGDVIVAKISTVGMHVRRDVIVEALRDATGAACGLERADSTAARREGFAAKQQPLWGRVPAEAFEIHERGRRYLVDVGDGQKTGFYLDQRDSRDLVEALARGRRTLDLYAYSGGFSVAAARGGAASVCAVESSASALDLARRNLEINAPDVATEFERADVHKFLRADVRQYDLIIVDPPPLARTKRDVTRASRAYKDVLLYAFARAAPGAFVAAFACSHPIGPELFRMIVFGAALDAKRHVSVLRTLGPPVDHPVSIDHPEGSYLTGLLLQT